VTGHPGKVRLLFLGESCKAEADAVFCPVWPVAVRPEGSIALVMWVWHLLAKGSKQFQVSAK